MVKSSSPPTTHSLPLHSHLTSQTISKWTLLVFLFFHSHPKHTTPPSPLFFNLTPFPRVYKFFTSNCTCKDFKKRASIVTNVVYTEREAKVTQQRKNAGSDSDEISLLNERIRKDQSKREQNQVVQLIGLIKMFNAGGAIKDLRYKSEESRTIDMKVRGCGTFGAYSSVTPKRIRVDKEEVDFQYDGVSGMIRLELRTEEEELYQWNITIQL